MILHKFLADSDTRNWINQGKFGKQKIKRIGC